jgi:Cu+-exporting ATPase
LTTKTEHTLPIYGMSCQKCVAKITAALQAVDGVSAVVVSLEEQQGRVQVVAGGPSREELLNIVIATGFQTVVPLATEEPEAAEGSAETPIGTEITQSTIFAVQGMTCANCAQTIEKGVAKLTGVSSASVNFAAEKLSVVYDPSLVQRAELIAKVEALGYRATSEDEVDQEEGRLQLYWLLFAACLSLPIMPLMWFAPLGKATIYLICALSTIVQFSAGLTFYRSAWNSLKNRSTNMDVLVAMGITAAYGYSLLALFNVFGLAGEVFF